MPQRAQHAICRTAGATNGWLNCGNCQDGFAGFSSTRFASDKMRAGQA
jgi:hypothetical protein